MLRHIEVNDPAPIVGKDNQHEQHSQSRRGYSEEVNRHDVLDVLLQERGPRRRSRPVQLRSILLHRRLRTPRVIAVVGLNRRAPGPRHLPNGRLLAPDCALTWSRIHRAAHPKPPNRDNRPRFRPMLDCATVLGGWEESSGKSQIRGKSVW